MRKFLAIVLCGSACAGAAFAQTPAPMPKPETRVFSMTFGDGGYLGVQTTEVTKDNFAKYGLREIRGVAIEKVMDNSPAVTAGLQAGDVIVKFNGEDVTSVRKLTRLIGEVDPDHQVRVTVIRGGSERELTATLGKRPTPKFEDGSFSMAVPRIENFPGRAPRPFSVPSTPGEGFTWMASPRRQIGVGITPLTKQLSAFFGVEDGLLINNVREDSPAAKAGLKAGDIIVEVNGKAVKDDGEAFRSIGEKKEGDVQLTIVRDKNRQTIRVTPEEVKGGFAPFFEFQDGDALLAPKAPGMPQAAPAPVPLNQLFIPGRVL